MLHSIDQVGPDLLVTLSYLSVLALVTGTLVIFKVLKFQLGTVFPPCVSVLLIKLESLSIVSWDLKSEHILE